MTPEEITKMIEAAALSDWSEIAHNYPTTKEFAKGLFVAGFCCGAAWAARFDFKIDAQLDKNS